MRYININNIILKFLLKIKSNVLNLLETKEMKKESSKRNGAKQNVKKIKNKESLCRRKFLQL